ncbi:peptide/nickel transport system substrate-binding protein [Umezawaea tangerina]|uniref:Peptide/nickel transport system substrate-binding protein n=1 Tax=Umezawaea tangerina TaxID=84725 RepID=A0A2T0SMW3_9PSEU|nr:peptide/nickel transport system substrate-binding protein [Umezawaea tangerina]
MGILRRLGSVVGAVGLVASPLAPAAQAQQPVTLRVAIIQQVDSLNPFLATYQASTEVGRLMYDYLTAYDAKDQRPVEGVAKSWEKSADNLTWTFTVPDGKKWSDGQPITAKDVGFTYNLMMTDKDAATANGSFVANFESVTVPDDRTVVIKTKVPQASMLALDVPIVPEHVWKGVGKIADYKNDVTPSVSSGPFVLSEYRANEFIKFKANKEYWRGAPKYDELHFIYYKTVDAAVQALDKGELDLVNRMGPAQFDSLKGKSGITLNKAQGRRFNELVLNSGAATKTGEPIGDGHPALKDVKVRQAIAKAIDQDAIIARVNGGYAERGTGPIPPVFPDYHLTPEKVRPFDPAAANTELDQAGYPKGSDGIRVGADGKPLKLRLVGHTSRAYDEQAGEYIKSSLADIGIAVDVQLVADTLLDEQGVAGKFDLIFSGWGTNPDPDFILSLHTCDSRPESPTTSGTTDTFFCDKTYDELYAKQGAELDPAKRSALVKQMQQRFYDEVPAIILGHDNSLEAYRNDTFASFTIQPDPGGVIMAQNGMWGYYGAVPVAAAGAASSGPSGLLIAGIVVVVLLVVGGVLLLARRRGATAGDRE